MVYRTAQARNCAWRLRNIVSAPQSTAASFVRREFKRHLFVVGSLDKQMQNEKEPNRLASAGAGGLFWFCVWVINLAFYIVMEKKIITI